MIRLIIKRVLWLSVGIAIVTAVYIAYREADFARDLSDPVRARREGRPIPVRTAWVTESNAELVAGGTVLTVPSELIVLRAGPERSKIGDPTGGLVVRTIRATEGTNVRAGQLLVELQNRAGEQVVKQREAALTAAKAELERTQQTIALNRKLRDLEVTSAEAEVKFRVEDFDSRKAAYQAVSEQSRQGVVSYLELYDMAARRSEAAFRLTEAERRLQRAREMITAGQAADQADLTRSESLTEAARIDLETGRINQERCQIHSPISGILTRFDVSPGQAVAAEAPLAQVMKLDPLHVRMDLPIDRIRLVAVGQKAEVTLDGFPQESFAATVIQISPQANAELRILPVTLELRNSDGRLKAGLTGFARMKTARMAVSVPKLAVMRQGERAVVFRVEEGRARVREVVLGSIVRPEMVEVQDGLVKGDEVVVFHNFYATSNELTVNNCFIQDNDRVDADWRKWTRRD